MPSPNELRPGHYAVVPQQSQVTLTGYAPMHRFVADGAGVEGKAAVGPGVIESAEVSFPLDILDAHDATKTHELKKFFGLDTPQGANLVARATLLEPARVAGTPSGSLAADARFRVEIGTRAMDTAVHLEGTNARVQADFQLTFSDLGYQVPRMLFLRMKDVLDLQVSLSLHLNP